MEEDPSFAAIGALVRRAGASETLAKICEDVAQSYFDEALASQRQWSLRDAGSVFYRDLFALLGHGDATAVLDDAELREYVRWAPRFRDCAGEERMIVDMLSALLQAPVTFESQHGVTLPFDAYSSRLKASVLGQAWTLGHSAQYGGIRGSISVGPVDQAFREILAAREWITETADGPIAGPKMRVLLDRLLPFWMDVECEIINSRDGLEKGEWRLGDSVAGRLGTTSILRQLVEGVTWDVP
jgi:predicted component of type VI protein secretion system